MTTRSKSWCSICLRMFALVIALVGPASVLAEPILLSELIQSNGHVVSGNSRFDQFAVLQTGEMPFPDAINVMPIQDANGNFGIRFQGGFVDGAAPGPSELTISYRATVLDESQGLFTGLQLAGNAVAVGQATVEVHVDLMGANLSEPLTIYDDAEAGTMLLNSAMIHPSVSGANIDLFVSAESKTPLAAGTLSFIDMTFQQTHMPEPNHLRPLVILGALFLLQRRRRRC
ncbi:MAG: hypothetical protein R3C28_13235 [Pirellulaceae bacterium]